MPRVERSAGVIVVGYPPDSPNLRHYLLLDYGRHWDYAKGHVKAGESDQQAALRELKEETGIESAALLPGFAHEINYFFRHPKRGLIRKTVIFFLAEAPENLKVTLSHEHVGYAFLPYEQALTRLTFRSARELLRLSEAFLSARPDTSAFTREGIS